MKKASNILLLVGTIIAIITAVSFLIVAITSFASSAFIAELKELAKQYVGEDLDVETAELLIRIFVVVYGITFAICGLLNIILAIVANGARKADAKKSSFIRCIVFGAIAGGYVCLAGGILGLIAYGKEQKQEDPEVIDAEISE